MTGSATPPASQLSPATTPETPLEPPRSAEPPAAGVPGPPDGPEGHAGPRTGRIVAMIVSRSSTQCSECGGSVVPGYGDDQAHVMTSGYDQRKGCGATWTHITTDVSGDNAEADAQALAPHLPWIDYGDVVRQMNAEAKSQTAANFRGAARTVERRTAQRDDARTEVERLEEELRQAGLRADALRQQVRDLAAQLSDTRDERDAARRMLGQRERQRQGAEVARLRTELHAVQASPKAYRTDDGTITVDWPDGAVSCLVTRELLDELVAEQNKLTVRVHTLTGELHRERDLHGRDVIDLTAARAEIARLHGVLRVPTVESVERQQVDAAMLATLGAEVERLAAELADARSQAAANHAMAAATVERRTAQRDQARAEVLTLTGDLAVEREEVERLRIVETASIGAHALLDDANAEVERLRGFLAEAMAEADLLDAADSGRCGPHADDPNEVLERIRREAAAATSEPTNHIVVKTTTEIPETIRGHAMYHHGPGVSQHARLGIWVIVLDELDPNRLDQQLRQAWSDLGITREKLAAATQLAAQQRTQITQLAAENREVNGLFREAVQCATLLSQNLTTIQEQLSQP